MSEQALKNEKTLTRKKSKAYREINTIIAVMAREITVFFKSPAAIIMSLAMPVVMMWMIGGNMMQNMTMAGADGNSGMGAFMLVGMLINMLFMTVTQGMTSLVDDHDSDFNQEMLVSPVSRYSLVIGKILGSTFGAIVSMIGTIVVGLFMGITLPVGQLLLILLLSPLMCLAAGAMSMIFIGLIKNKKAANMVVMLISMPQMFLSGGIIPVNNSEGILKIISRCLPMTYCIDLARAIVGSDQPVMFNPIINFIAILTITIVCLVIGTFFYARTEKNR